MSREKRWVYTCDICLKQEPGWMTSTPVGWAGSITKNGMCLCRECHMAHIDLRHLNEKERAE